MHRTTSAVALLVFAVSATAQWRTVPYPETGAALGVGWRTMMGAQADAYCVDFVPRKDEAQKGGTIVGEFRLVDKLNETLKESYTFKVKAAGLASASSTPELSGSYDYNVEDQSFAAVTNVFNAPEVADATPEAPLALKTKYLKMLVDGNAQQFVKECGDSFVLRLTGGARLIALASSRSLTEEARSGVKLSYDASGAIGFSVKGTRDDNRTQSRLETTTHFAYRFVGGSGATGATDVASLKVLIASLNKLAADAPAYWQMDVRRYETLSNWPSGMDLSTVDTRVYLAAAMYGRLRQLEQAAAAALANPGDYIGDSIFQDDLEAVVTDTRAVMKELAVRIPACSQDAARCNALPQTDRFDYYWYYTRLPLHGGANEYDERKTELTKALDKANVELARALDAQGQKMEPQFRPLTCRSFGVALAAPRAVLAQYAQFEVSKEYREAVAACVEQAKAARAAAVLSLADEERAIKETVAQRWLRSLSFEACQMGDHPMCLTTAQLREWEELIQTRRYGWCGTKDNLSRCTSAANSAPLFGRDGSPRSRLSDLFPK